MQKVCKTRRSPTILKNKFLFAKTVLDTAKNVPSEVFKKMNGSFVRPPQEPGGVLNGSARGMAILFLELARDICVSNEIFCDYLFVIEHMDLSSKDGK